MKKLITMLCLIALITGVNAQNINIDDAIGVETENVYDSKASKSTLWSNAIMWSKYISTEINKSVELEDEENGTIILKLSTYLPKEKGINEYSKIKTMMNLKIDCKDDKYRLIFSNFTSTVEVDRNNDVNNMTTSGLQDMIDELELIADLSASRFKKEVIWDINKVLEAKEIYVDRNDKYQETINSLDASSRKGKREIQSMEAFIKKNNKYINYLDYILDGFGSSTEKIKAEINSKMEADDDW